MKPGRRSHEYAAAKPARTPGRVRTYQMSEWYVPNEVSMHVLELRSSHRHLWVIKCIVSLLHYRMHLACCRLVLACPAVVAAGARERAPRRRRRAVASSPARRRARGPRPGVGACARRPWLTAWAALASVGMASPERRRRVVCVGAAGVDTIFSVPSSWQDGPPSAKLLPTDCVVLGAGMASSAAAAVVSLGGDSEIWARVGGDAAGKHYIEDMRTAGVDVRHVRVVDGGARTTMSTILVTPNGERLVVPFYDPEMDPSTDHLPLDSLTPARCSCVLADVRWPEGAAAALNVARANGVPTVLDGDTAPYESLQLLVPLADYVVFSEPGLAIYTGANLGSEHSNQQQSLDDALLRVAADLTTAASSRGAGSPAVAGSVVGCVAVTLGDRGWRWVQLHAADAAADLHRVYDQVVRGSPAPQVSVVDTLSAGDVFHGAFALGISRQDTLKGSAADAASHLSTDILQDLEGVGLFASAAAAVKCTRSGGRLGCPRRAELMHFLGQWDVWAGYLARRFAQPETREEHCVAASKL